MISATLVVFSIMRAAAAGTDAANSGGGVPSAIFIGRCNADTITEPMVAVNRNAWARKCGYLDASEQDAYNADHRYAVFLDGVAPVEPSAPCPLPEWGLIGPCPLGCFEISQGLVFGREFLSVADAYRNDAKVLTGLSDDATLQDLRYADHSIGRYTAGPTDVPLVSLTAADGRALAVTADHPLVGCDGNIFAASAARPGHALLSTDGCKCIAAISSLWTDALVWNVEPDSLNILENTNIANGFITGSLRFQNEWAHDDYRFRLRKRLQTAATARGAALAARPGE